VAENILHAAPEDPQEPHVAGDMQKSAVDEHGSQDRHIAKAIRHNTVLHDEAVLSVARQSELVGEHENIDDDDGERDGGARIVRLGGSKGDHLRPRCSKSGLERRPAPDAKTRASDTPAMRPRAPKAVQFRAAMAFENSSASRSGMLSITE